MIRFDAAYLIALPRLGRIEAFYDGFPPDWPVPEPITFHAIDAEKVPIPEWWTDIPSLYACGESHRSIIAHALSCDHQSIAIFEDDCGFVAGSGPTCREFLEQVPGDWDAVMFGGQVSDDDGRTIPITDRVSRCVQVERLHAYGLSRRGMRVFYEALSRCDTVANDYRFGDLQEQGKLIAYRCEPFVAFQRDGLSSISGRVEAQRVWDDRVDVRLRKPSEVPVVSLVCPFDVLERLRRDGIVCNGGESPPALAKLTPGRVQKGETEIAEMLLDVSEHDPALATLYIERMRNDAAFHRGATLVVWHPRRAIPYRNAPVIEAGTFEEAEAKLHKIAQIRAKSARTARE